jgi:hypothetical protein
MNSTDAGAMQAVWVVTEQKLLTVQHGRAFTQRRIELESISTQKAQLKQVEETLGELERCIKLVLFHGGVLTARGRTMLSTVDRLEESLIWRNKAIHREQRVHFVLSRNKADLYLHSAMCLKQSLHMCGPEPCVERDVWFSAHDFVVSLTGAAESLSVLFEYKFTFPKPDVTLEETLHSCRDEHQSESSGIQRLAWLWCQRSWAHDVISQIIFHYVPNPPIHYAMLRQEHSLHSITAKEVASKYIKACAENRAREQCVVCGIAQYMRDRVVQFATTVAELYADIYPVRFIGAAPAVFNRAKDLENRCAYLLPLLAKLEKRARQRELIAAAPRIATLASVQLLLSSCATNWRGVEGAVREAPILQEGVQWEMHYTAELEPLLETINHQLPGLEEVNLAVRCAEKCASLAGVALPSEAHKMESTMRLAAQTAMDDYFNGIGYTLHPCSRCYPQIVPGLLVHSKTLLLRARNYMYAAEGMCATAVEYTRSAATTAGEVAEQWNRAAIALNTANVVTYMDVCAMHYGEVKPTLRRAQDVEYWEGLACFDAQLATELPNFSSVSTLAQQDGSAATIHHQQATVLRQIVQHMYGTFQMAEPRNLARISCLKLLRAVLLLVQAAAVHKLPLCGMNGEGNVQYADCSISANN